jgi:hypothetical protein
MAPVQSEQTGGNFNKDFISNADGSILRDHKGVRCVILSRLICRCVEPMSDILNFKVMPLLYRSQNPITVERYLSTKPLRSEVSSRKGEHSAVTTAIL